jgi:hypothetical protein
MTTSPADAAKDINVGDKLMIEGAGSTRMFTVSGLVEFGSSNLPLYDFRSGGPIDQPARRYGPGGANLDAASPREVELVGSGLGGRRPPAGAAR